MTGIKKTVNVLDKYYNEDDILEIGIDEAGRGPMLGRVYAAAVILPKTEDFKHHLMKDSKKFTSKKKITEVAEYIKENAIAWSVAYSTEEEIDKINILQATYKAMHAAIRGIDGLDITNFKTHRLLVDGSNFKRYTEYSDQTGIANISHTCITGGDNKYTSIAAASILAKTERDLYIENLCMENPTLDERYCISKNKGYGTKIHIDGINKYGITEYHRKTFGICRHF
jgi:ribonuclease HII|tara:strand:+ start:269 stop:949 length:681 start_codon:yes stop_codon:yes gene_type:complete